MPDPFDPYFEWLGIEGGGQPPDHYRLLGLKQFESDPELIGRAADAAMAQVRRIRPGAHLAEWSRLLDQLGSTKTCLLAAQSRKTYDESLLLNRSSDPGAGTWPMPVEPQQSFFATLPTLAIPPQPSHEPAAAEERPRSPFPVGYSEPPVYAVAGASVSPPPTLPEPAAYAPALVEEPVPELWPAAAPSKPVAAPTAASSGMGSLIAGLVVLAIASGGIFAYYAVYQRNVLAAKGDLANANASETIRSPAAPGVTAHAPAPPKPPRKPLAEKPQALAMAANPQAAKSEPAKPQVAAAAPAKPEAEKPKPDSEKPKPETEKPKPELDAKMTATLTQAVADARTCMAERNLVAAGKHIKAASANAQTQEERDQVDRLQTMLENLSQFWKGIQASMAKLQAAEELVVKDNRIVVIESSSDFLKVKAEGRILSFQAATLPTPLVLVLVNQCFGKDPGSKAIVGTFLAVDPNGDRALAKQYWQEAARAGIDSEKLLREIDASAAAGGGSKTDPPTDKAQLQKAEQLVRDTFKDKFAGAVNPVSKAGLARELLARAAAEAGNPDARFVMLREAKDLAAAAGQPALVGQVIDQMARYFNVDVLKLKSAALAETVKAAHSAGSQREIAQTALTLLNQAVEEQRLDEAGRLATLALEAARKSKNTLLMRQATAIGQQVQILRKQQGQKNKDSP